MGWVIQRLGNGPLIDSSTHESIGTNIQGPSVIRALEWLTSRLGRYLMYFADHKGSYIRLAFADDVEGPCKVHPSGSLQLADSHFLTEAPAASLEMVDRFRRFYEREFGVEVNLDEAFEDATHPHIASPDVHVDHDRRRIVMYFHGLDAFGVQVTRVALSNDGVRFEALPEVLGGSYFRVFRWQGWHYALVMPGLILRSRDGLTGFEQGPTLFEPAMRHSAVRVVGSQAEVFWTRAGDRPEAVLRSTIDLSGDWMTWQESAAEVVLAPKHDWEGASAPLEPSRRGAVSGLVNQLRDPCIFADGARTYLFYAFGGESGIALAELTD